MCYSIETYHVYTGCHLQDNNAQTQRPTELAWLLKRVTHLALRQPTADDEEADLQHHEIIDKTIFRCEPPCAEVLASGEGETLEKVAYTTLRGDCPVCEAVLKAIEENSKREFVKIVGPRNQRGRNSGSGTTGTTSTTGTRANPVVHGTPRPNTRIKKTHSIIRYFAGGR